MRLFHVSVLLLTVPLWGCKRESNSTEGVLRVFISYSTFRMKCMKLIVEDPQDPSRRAAVDVTGTQDESSGTRTGIILEQKGWGRNLRVTAEAYEASCDGRVIARQVEEARFPEKDVTDLTLDLRAEDLDNDGYVAMKGALPGTDCDDTRADIHPGATELCDGVDNNCVAGESDVDGNVAYWVDADGDSYGDAKTAPKFACGAPPGAALRGGDCDDTNSAIHPGQAELTCDGKDDNCNGIPDDAPFNVGGTCETAQRCSGLLACSGTTASECISTEVPVPYYVDEDGDGNAGLVVGIACQPPEAGATRELTDCDEGTALASRAVGRVEVCDRLDNDCNGATDDGLATCASVQWRQDTPTVSGPPRFDAVATYAKRRGWLAGQEKVVHVNDAAFTVATNCDGGGDWKSAWAASQGRVFLGSGNGQFGTLVPGGEGNPCELRASGFAASINGLTGFEEANGDIILYAVTSQGRILRWRYVPGAPNQEAPVEVTQVAANLRAIHGVSPETLLAVGAENVGSQQRPVAFHAPATGTTWIREELGVPNATGFLNGVRVLTPRLAYVVGEDGLLLEKARDTWTQKLRLTLPNGSRPTLRSLAAFGRTAIYAVSSGTNDIHFFNGTSWSTVTTPPQTINALGGSGPGDVWAAGHSATLLRWTPP
ncbi:putative metal-binding motif-containing protein [Myxococcus stipitatus]|uniref:putative metal-binding motif-containing protein n=1 Tax=Myxococcus stipitatus TaxID=83455 RepID=UPI0030CC6B26